MASKKPKSGPTDEELLAQFDDLGTESKESKTKESGPKPTSSSAKSAPPSTEEADLLAELDNLAQERPKSRPHTPRNVPGSAASVRTSADAGTGSRTSEEKAQARKSAESSRSFHQSLTPVDNAAAELGKKAQEGAQQAREQAGGGGGGWWGGLMATASAAVKQAEAIAKDLRENEEAQKWAEQVRGNVGVLRSYGGELRSKALPTFTNILNTLAPPISSHERLQIHITHDFVGYPSLDPLIYQTFSRVMAQVEGGELMVIQRGQESKQRRPSEGAYRGANTAGWNDGPWWRDSSNKRDFGAVKGLVEGTKLAKVSAEAYANDYFAPQGGVEEAAKKAAEFLNESNPTRSSDIFLSIQAINHDSPKEFFGGGSQSQTGEKPPVADPESKPEELVCFALYLYDPVHGITFHTISQNLPQKWVGWINHDVVGGSSGSGDLSEDVQEIVHEGGVDPREWVSEWVEEVLALGVGIVAQRYVARRMGVGEGGLGRGKARQAVVEAGAGEAARAM